MGLLEGDPQATKYLGAFEDVPGARATLLADSP